MYMANTYFGHIHILNEPNIAKRQNILWAAGVSVFVGGENSNNNKKNSDSLTAVIWKKWQLQVKRNYFCAK